MDCRTVPTSVRFIFKDTLRGAWVAQPVKRPTSAQVMISQFVSSSPLSGSGLTAQSLKPACFGVCVCVCVYVSLSAPPLLALCLSLPLSLSLKNKH